MALEGLSLCCSRSKKWDCSGTIRLNKRKHTIFWFIRSGCLCSRLWSGGWSPSRPLFLPRIFMPFLCGPTGHTAVLLIVWVSLGFLLEAFLSGKICGNRIKWCLEWLWAAFRTNLRRLQKFLRKAQSKQVIWHEVFDILTHTCRTDAPDWQGSCDFRSLFWFFRLPISNK